MLFLLIILAAVYVLIGIWQYQRYLVESRKRPEYESMRNFQDTVEMFACAVWPLTLVLKLIWYSKRK